LTLLQRSIGTRILRQVAENSQVFAIFPQHPQGACLSPIVEASAFIFMAVARRLKTKKN
jgi:hypothetical protein